MHLQDPKFLEFYFGFCRALKTIEPDCEELGYRGKEDLLQDCKDILHPGISRPVISYTISKEPESLKQTRPTNLRLVLMRFLVLGTFLGAPPLKIEKNIEN